MLIIAIAIAKKLKGKNLYPKGKLAFSKGPISVVGEPFDLFRGKKTLVRRYRLLINKAQYIKLAPGN